MLTFGKQVGVIMYGAGLNVRAWADDFIRRGFVVVWRAGHATIHERVANKPV